MKGSKRGDRFRKPPLKRSD